MPQGILSRQRWYSVIICPLTQHVTNLSCLETGVPAFSFISPQMNQMLNQWNITLSPYVPHPYHN